MRYISPALLAAQQAASGTPYVSLTGVVKSMTVGTEDTVISSGAVGAFAQATFRCIAVDSTGRIFICYTDTDPATYDIRIAYSDNGTDWTDASVAARATDDEEQASICIDSADNIHMVWRYADDQQVWYTKLARDLSVVTAAEDLSSDASVIAGPQVRVDSNDIPHAMWTDNNDVWYSNRVGGTWAAKENVSENGDTNYYVHFDIDNGDDLHAAWEGKGYGTNTTIMQIIYKKRTSGTWDTTGTALTDEAAAQSKCTLAVDHLNYVHVAWDGGANGIRYKRYSATSWGAVETVDSDATTDNPALVVLGTGEVFCVHRDTTSTDTIYYTKRRTSWSTRVTASMTANYNLGAACQNIPKTLRPTDIHIATRSGNVNYNKITMDTVSTGDRVLVVIQTETPFGDMAEIILDNSDQYFSTEDYRGQLIKLGFGFVSESSPVPDLYVVKQEDISLVGKLFTRLVCIGNWGKLAMHRVMGDTPASALNTGTDTIATIITERLLSNMVLTVDSSDGTEDTKLPGALYEVFTDRRTIIQECNGLTNNLLKMRGSDMHMIEKRLTRLHMFTGTVSGTFTQGEGVTSNNSYTGTFVYQGTGYIVIEAEDDNDWSSETTITGDDSTEECASISAREAFDYKYGPLAGDHTFFDFIRTQSILEANRVVCVDTLPDTAGTTHTYPSDDTHYANDTDDQAVFGVSTLIFEDPSVTSDDEALASAEARLEHIKIESVGGEMTAPMNCGQEMYDMVEITDDRAGWENATALDLRVTKIVRRFSPGEYTIELGFGGLAWAWPDSFDLSLLVPDPPGITQREWADFYFPATTAPTPAPAPKPGPPVPAGWPEAGRVDAPVIIGSTGVAVTQEQYNISVGGVAKKIYEGLTPEQIEQYTASGRIRPTTEGSTPQWPRPKKERTPGTGKQGLFQSVLSWMRDWQAGR